MIGVTPRHDIEPRRVAALKLAFGATAWRFRPMSDDEQKRTARDIRAAVIFGVVAATLELGALLYFFR